MKRVGTDQDRGVWIHCLEPPYLLVDSLGGESFVALLAVYDRFTIAQRASVARSLVAQGCRRLVVLAGESAPWKSEIDNASAERFPGFVVPPGSEVDVQTFDSESVHEAVACFLEEEPGGDGAPNLYLAIACSGDPRRVAELEKTVGAMARGEIARMDVTPQRGASGNRAGEGRGLLSRSSRWDVKGQIFDAYGRCRPCRREVEMVSRRERSVMRSWLGDHEVLLAIRPLEPGSVATSWTAQHPRLGTLDGLVSVVERTIISTFASSDQKHRGAESFRWIDEDSYEVEGSLFAGPVLMSAWHYTMRRIAGPGRAAPGAAAPGVARDRPPRS